MIIEFSIDEISTELRRNWNVMQNSDYNPIPIALELLQSSNPTRDPESFTKIYDKLDNAMKMIINNNYTEFNDSISSFSSIVETLNQTRAEIRELKDHVSFFRDQLEFRRTDLEETWKKLEKLKIENAARREEKDLAHNIKKIKSYLEKQDFSPAINLWSLLKLKENIELTLLIKEKLYANILDILFEEEFIDPLRLDKTLVWAKAVEADFKDNFNPQKSIRNLVEQVIKQNPIKPITNQLNEAVFDDQIKGYIKTDLLSFGPSIKLLLSVLCGKFNSILEKLDNCLALKGRLNTEFQKELVCLIGSILIDQNDKENQEIQVPNPLVAINSMLRGERIELSPSNAIHPMKHPEIVEAFNQTISLKDTYNLDDLLKEDGEKRSYELPLKPNIQFLVYISSVLLSSFENGAVRENLSHFANDDYFLLAENWMVNRISSNITSSLDTFTRKSVMSQAKIFQSFAYILKKMILAKQSISMFPVERLLVILFESFSQKLEQIFKGVCVVSLSGEEKSLVKNVDLLSSIMAKSKTIRALLEIHPILRSEELYSNFDQNLAKKEIIHIEEIKRDRSLHQSEVLFDLKKWELLAIMHSGCEYITACLDGEYGKEFGLEFFERELRLICAILLKQPTEFISFANGDVHFKQYISFP